jgi:lipopolysaccharide/colanic/teichoic acid biosynthesis glycosyltransferase
VVPRLFAMGVGLDSLTPDRVRGYPLVRVQRSAHPQIALKFKRLTDIVASAVAIIVVSPVLAIAAMAVRFTSPGPVLFRQERVGHHGRLIVVLKFRSMTVGNGDAEWTSESRITRVGGFLRRSSVDELPQLFSIFRGDMSLVGPRPERTAFVEKFREEYAEYDERHRMPAGLTGLAQVVGYVGDTSIEERLKYDNLYIDQWSYGTDMQLIFKTVWSVVCQGRRKHENNDLTRVLSEGATITLTDSTIDVTDSEDDLAKQAHRAG